MNISNATVIYFTGTDTTKQYSESFAQAIPYETTLHSLRYDKPILKKFSHDELLVLAGPVFGGYLPSFVWEQLSNVTGSDTPVVLLAVYGARDYDNALLEMQTKLKEKGFITIGAAALVARHSIATSIAANRPDNQDKKQVQDFAKEIAQRLEDLQSIENAPEFQFKGNLDGHPAKNPAPVVTDKCTECGICAYECPVGAIPEDKPNTTDETKCISCMRCIEYCSFEARHAPDAILQRVESFLADKADPTKPNEFF